MSQLSKVNIESIEIAKEQTSPSKQTPEFRIRYLAINVGQGDCALVLLEKRIPNSSDYNIFKSILLDAGTEDSDSTHQDNIMKVLKTELKDNQTQLPSNQEFSKKKQQIIDGLKQGPNEFSKEELLKLSENLESFQKQVCQMLNSQLDAVVISHWDKDQYNLLKHAQGWMGNETHFFAPEENCQIDKILPNHSKKNTYRGFEGIFLKKSDTMREQDSINNKKSANQQSEVENVLIKPSSLWDFICTEKEKKELEENGITFDFLSVDCNVAGNSSKASNSGKSKNKDEDKSITNKSSISCLIMNKETSLLTQGDLSIANDQAIKEYITQHYSTKLCICKSNNHGSKKNNSHDKAQSNVVVIPFRRINRHGYPDLETIVEYVESDEIDIIFGGDHPKCVSLEFSPENILPVISSELNEIIAKLEADVTDIEKELESVPETFAPIEKSLEDISRELKELEKTKQSNASKCKILKMHDNLQHIRKIYESCQELTRIYEGFGDESAIWGEFVNDLQTSFDSKLRVLPELTKLQTVDSYDNFKELVAKISESGLKGSADVGRFVKHLNDLIVICEKGPQFLEKFRKKFRTIGGSHLEITMNPGKNFEVKNGGIVKKFEEGVLLQNENTK